MILRKNYILITVAFLSIFFAKMFISGAPVFFKCIDKEIMKSVIMQIELEHSSEGDSKSSIKYNDYKLIDFFSPISSFTILSDVGVKNSFIDHYKRYFNPFHPTVPTPPPNFC